MKNKYNLTLEGIDHKLYKEIKRVYAPEVIEKKGIVVRLGNLEIAWYRKSAKPEPELCDCLLGQSDKGKEGLHHPLCKVYKKGKI